ncbi:MAG TPA: thioredoxin [Acidimicrobiia bacterium]|nr:thioredoxin [Acidimicrobiia bacterium]
MTAAVRDVSTAEFPDAVVARSWEIPVVVDFWAAWCGPCRVLGPILEKAASHAEGGWELAKVDVDANQQLAAQFGVQGIPTVIGFRDGQPVARFTGALPEPSVMEWLQRLLPTPNDRLAKDAVEVMERGDSDAAEEVFRRVLADEPAHLLAGTGLASLLIDAGRPDEALTLLARLAPTAEVQRLQSTARTRGGAGELDELEAKLASAPDDHQVRLDYGRALAAEGRNAEALEHLLTVVAARHDDVSDQARQAMVDLFDVLGEDPLVSEYRRKLANSLF